jgi:hypothetical protein
MARNVGHVKRNEARPCAISAMKHQTLRRNTDVFYDADVNVYKCASSEISVLVPCGICTAV